jgi:hypothetical protein
MMLDEDSFTKRHKVALIMLRKLTVPWRGGHHVLYTDGGARDCTCWQDDHSMTSPCPHPGDDACTDIKFQSSLEPQEWHNHGPVVFSAPEAGFRPPSFQSGSA